MNSPVVGRRLATRILGLAVLCCGLFWEPNHLGYSATRTVDPAQVVPIDQIAPENRESVSEVIREHTFHRKGAPETFPCNPRVYLFLLNEPGITLSLWQDLSTSPVRLQQIAPNRYQGSDGAGASATWEFVYRSPKLNVLLCNLDYTSPRGAAHLQGRVVLVVHTGYFREASGEHWVQHDVEAYVKVDSKGWKAVARTVRPLIEKLLEDQVREAGWFVSLMGRLVAMYPNWACQVTGKQEAINLETRTRFRDVVIQTRKPGAFTGRPTMVENTDPNVKRR
ncbi:hypothetical protein [Singulisphaera sp. PoT]|uniref:hypothetical protein n=1 Tax=Singulisphaera sp. PoT TaxID=3411797 RepID=UPI003BF5504F